MVTILCASRRSGRRLPRFVFYGKRASLARLALPVQRLLGWNLAAVLIHVMDIERSIRMQEERTRSADAGELVHMFDGRVRKPAGVQVHSGFALHFHSARAAHHHQLFVGRMKVPGRATAFRALDQQDRRSVRWVTPFHRQRRSEEHTSELQSHLNLVCRLLLEKKKKKKLNTLLHNNKKKQTKSN